MTDAELIAFGEAARKMCWSVANLATSREPFVIQLREAREEWKRRWLQREGLGS